MSTENRTPQQLLIDLIAGLRSERGRGLHDTVAAELVLAHLRGMVQSLPAEHTPPTSNGSIDFGRGYSAAIRDVLDLLQ